MWQDLVFMIGSGLSIVFLAPTLRDPNARVPLSTSAPSALIGVAYAISFATLGMGLSAAGAFTAAAMWTLIGWLRSPGSVAGRARDRASIAVRLSPRWHLPAVRLGRSVDRLRTLASRTVRRPHD